MVFKTVNATAAKSGTTILVEGVACVVKSNDISKTGRHGHAKCRIEAVGIIDGKKRVFICGGHEKLEIPHIEKRKAQVLNMVGDKASVMDLESFETLEIAKDQSLELKGGEQIEYWKIGEEKIIKRKI